MNETCEKMLATMSLICQQLHAAPWDDDFEYICWAYLTGDKNLPLSQQNNSPDSSILNYLQFLKTAAEEINGWVNDITYIEMDRWLILYSNWQQRN